MILADGQDRISDIEQPHSSVISLNCLSTFGDYVQRDTDSENTEM